MKKLSLFVVVTVIFLSVYQLFAEYDPAVINIPEPSAVPTLTPTLEPSPVPTPHPIMPEPSAVPTLEPSAVPTLEPSKTFTPKLKKEIFRHLSHTYKYM